MSLCLKNNVGLHNEPKAVVHLVRLQTGPLGRTKKRGIQLVRVNGKMSSGLKEIKHQHFTFNQYEYKMITK
jgi:hypothetical protein